MLLAQIHSNFWYYRRPLLSAGLQFMVLIIRGYLLLPQNLLSAAFPSFFADFGVNCHKNHRKCLHSTPLLFAISLFAGYLENVTLENKEGNVYFIFVSRIPLARFSATLEEKKREREHRFPEGFQQKRSLQRQTDRDLS